MDVELPALDMPPPVADGLYTGASRDPTSNPALMELMEKLQGDAGTRVVPLLGKEVVAPAPPRQPASSYVPPPPAPPAHQHHTYTVPPAPTHPGVYTMPASSVPPPPAVPGSLSAREDLQSVLQRLRAAAPAQVAVPKDALQLFVGNVVGDGSAHNVDLKDFLNLAMRQVGLTTSDADPIVECRQNSKFSFIEFRSADDCTAGLSLNGIPFMGALLKISRPSKYTGPREQAKTWQELTGQSVPAGVMSESADPSTKIFREIFVGNTPQGTTETALSEFIGGALLRMGMARPEGNQAISSPILGVRINAKFCFLEFRTVEEAANCLNLNGIPFAGASLNIKRVAKHDSSLGPDPSTHHTWDSLLASWMTGELKIMTAGKPTRVLCVTNMVTEADVTNTEDYEDLLEDTLHECSQYGQIKSVFVERQQALEMAQRGGAGRLFVEAQSQDDARQVLVALKGRTFDGRTVDVKYYSEQAWAEKSYLEPLDHVIVSSVGPVPVSAVFAKR